MNLTAPNPVTNAELTKTLGRVLHRPTVIPTPRFGLKAVYGAELVATLLLGGQRVRPTMLEASGFAQPILEAPRAARSATCAVGLAPRRQAAPREDPRTLG